MRNNKVQLDMPIGKLTKVEDFLPSPDKLVMPDNSVKITLRVSKPSMEFFKQQAKKHHTKYQKMIRSLLDKYSKKYRLQH